MIAADGGPAFPGDTGTGYVQMDVSGVAHALTEPHQGMSLRDYFAAKAMESLLLLANDTDTGAPNAIATAGGVAPYAYQVADLMLKARQA